MSRGGCVASPVSILTQSSDWVRRSEYEDLILRLADVSILTQSSDWVRRYSMHGTFHTLNVSILTQSSDWVRLHINS